MIESCQVCSDPNFLTPNFPDPHISDAGRRRAAQCRFDADREASIASCLVKSGTEQHTAGLTAYEGRTVYEVLHLIGAVLSVAVIIYSLFHALR